MLVEVELREILQGVDIVPTIVLACKNGDPRTVPIQIGHYEVEMLERAVHGRREERPLTHDLILNVIEGMGGELKRVIVDKVTHENFHGKLELELNDRSRTLVDTRPSDAIVLASKLSLPIFVEEEVLRRTGQGAAETPDEDE